jgi:hypothetical protein
MGYKFVMVEKLTLRLAENIVKNPFGLTVGSLTTVRRLVGSVTWLKLYIVQPR